ncbi:MAG: hypothetical protein M3Y72_14030, partial [Acidobacteriota bacterium]|nr:hypothetical protein [Acidobacteriota bacterium]
RRRPGASASCQSVTAAHTPPGQSYSDRRIGGHSKFPILAHQFQAVAQQRDGPGTNRNVRKNDMERLANPGAIQEILNSLPI